SELGDGGHLAQQPQGVEAALFDRARRPRQLRGPAELALDLLDELADLGGGGFRLLALDADERRLVLLIIEQDVQNAVGHQRDTDHRDKQHDVLREQAAAGLCDGRFGRRLLRRISGNCGPSRVEPRKPLRKSGTFIDDHRTKVGPSCPSCREDAPVYSITSSASAITVGGTVRPSVVAVLSLIANSNLAGACARGSARVAPFRIRSTYEAERRKMSDVSGPYDIRPPSLMTCR